MVGQTLLFDSSGPTWRPLKSLDRAESRISRSAEIQDSGTSSYFKSRHVGPKVSEMKFGPPLDAPESGLSSARRINIVRQTLERITTILWKSEQKSKNEPHPLTNLSVGKSIEKNACRVLILKFFSPAARPTGAKPSPLFCVLNKQPITTFNRQKYTDNPNLRQREQTQLFSWIWSRRRKL